MSHLEKMCIRDRVEEAHPSEPVLLVGLGGVNGVEGRADQVAGDAEANQAERVDAVIETHRELPHIDAPILHRLRDCRR